MGQVGFGAYRVSIKSEEHRAALTRALELGCTLIDTSSNYTNGDSEELIGEILSKNPVFNPLIITKAGYIQGKNLKVLSDLNDQGLALQDLVEINENLKHSIHPDFLVNQLTQSLIRLKRTSVDFFLLHNPEYYFETKDATQDEYYSRLEKAFLFCESEVKLGRIKAYGISSNNFILPVTDPKVTSLAKILEILKKIKAENFKMVQFPFNLIEINALEKFGDYGSESLLELCMQNEIISVVNRPLNAFTQNKLIRLATYEDDYKNLDDKKANKAFDNAMTILKQKWDENSDDLVTADDFFDVEIIKQFKALWSDLATPDAVEQVYYSHIFPFVVKVWGKNLTPEESKPFYELMEYSQAYSRRKMSIKALDFRKQAQDLGLLQDNIDKEFAVMAIETYLDYGFDYVLVGMKKTAYVDQLSHLF